MIGHVGHEFCEVPASNRFPLLSQSDVFSEGEELGKPTGPDPVGSNSLPNARSPNNLVRKQSTACTHSENIDA